MKHMDRISNLPVDIIHQIMSHLSTKEVAQTSLLSKQWRDYLRPSFPFLIFNHLDFLEKDLRSSCPAALFKNHPEKFTNSIQQLTEFVDATLTRFSEMKLAMQKFRLTIIITGDLDCWSRLVDAWIGLAVENHVKNLHLNVYIAQNALYTLPDTIFSAKSITVLSLHGCKLDHPQFSDALRFPSLTKLKLLAVSLDELMIQKLTGSSPFLEDIALRSCWGFAHCRVPKLQRLKNFDICSPSEDFESIEITAPSLRECYLNFFDIERPLNRIRLVECHNLVSLCLTGNLITDEEFQNLISKLPLLEELWVVFCNFLRRVTISSQTLKKLEFTECDALDAICIDTPNLHYFYFMGEQIPVASIHAPCTWEIAFNPLREVDTLWYLKLKRFLGTSHRTQGLSIDIEIDEHSFNLQDFRQSSSSQPCEVQSLHLGVLKIPEIEYAALMDAYFSICYPKTLSIQAYSDRDYETSKFYAEIYETMARRDAYCCGGIHVKCWRHYLKDIKIESFEGLVVSLEGDPLMNAWPNLPKGCVRFALEWHSDVEIA